MPQKTEKPRFIFHGNAMPFGGRMVSIGGKPFADTVPGPPSGSLAVIGGWTRAESKGSSYRDVFSWGATLANSKGELRADGHFITTVTSSIAGVRAKNDPFPFEAARLSITMVSDHYSPDEEPSIIATEIVFEDLKLDGQLIEPEWDKDLVDHPTFASFEREYQNNEKFFRKYQKTLKDPSREATFGDPMPRIDGGYVATSFVRSLRWKKKKYPGNVLTLKGFGSIYFGEVLMNENNRRVTLVRLAMGSTVEAEAAYAEADPNGTWGN